MTPLRALALATVLALPLGAAACTSGTTPNCADTGNACDPYDAAGGDAGGDGSTTDSPASETGAGDTGAVDTGTTPPHDGGAG